MRVVSTDAKNVQDNIVLVNARKHVGLLAEMNPQTGGQETQENTWLCLCRGDSFCRDEPSEWTQRKRNFFFGA